MLNKVLIYLSILFIVTVLGGCSALQPKPPEEIIADRAMAQVRHLMDRDYDSALTYVVPSYQSSARAQFYQAEFVGSASWIDASVRWVKCDAAEQGGGYRQSATNQAPQTDRCNVRLWVYGSLPSPGGVTSARGDDVPWSWNTVWVKIDGKWYQYLD